MKVLFKFKADYSKEEVFLTFDFTQNKYRNIENRFWCWLKDFEEFTKLHEDLLQTKT